MASALLGPADIRALADALGVRPTKKLGQNFLHDANTIRRIVRTAELEPQERVLEVGPGLGSLTLGLLEAGADVVAVEIDHQIGAERHMDQLPLQPVDRGIAFEIFDQMIAVAQRDEREIAVEIGARAQVEAALHLAEVRLRRADRIGMRHDDDIARDSPGSFRLAKPLAQEMHQGRARKLAGMQGGLSTRMGAALRHAGHHLLRQPQRRKLVLLVTDGEPADVDERDPQYLRQDARKAVEELHARGILTYCLSLDPQADTYVKRIFGAGNYTVIDRVQRLPEKLPALFASLTG